MPHRIPNEQLRAADMPPPGSGWDEVQEFALSYEGYEAFGFEGCSQLANGGNPESLAELRAVLFFEQRRWRHFGHEPDGDAMAAIQATVERIRAAASA